MNLLCDVEITGETYSSMFSKMVFELENIIRKLKESHDRWSYYMNEKEIKDNLKKLDMTKVRPSVLSKDGVLGSFCLLLGHGADV